MGYIKEIVREIQSELLTWRRHLHQHPELSFREVRTAQYVYDELKKLDFFELTKPTETSVLAIYNSGKPGKTIALRADMDALPIEEETDLPFSSVNKGVMHACGHDGHTAILLGVALLLAKGYFEIEGEIRLIFQHAEEEFPGGAKDLVEAGVLKGVDFIIGNHLRSTMKTGQAGITIGEALAAPDRFKIKIIGQGGHAAKPNENVDSILISAQVIINLQSIVARQLNPVDDVVLSVTTIHSGTADNIMPNEVILTGTVRSFNPQVRAEMPNMMRKIIFGITEAYGATYEFSYTEGYHPLINDADLSKMVQESIIEEYGEKSFSELPKIMGGEDFSAYLQEIPGCFYFIGAADDNLEKLYPHHHPKFQIDEDSLQMGTTLFLKMLNKTKNIHLKSI